MVWDVFKVTRQGNYISAIKAVRSEYTSLTLQFENLKAAAAESFAEHHTTLSQARRDVKLHYISLTQTDFNLLAGKIFKSGDKNGHLLASLVADPHYQTVVSELQEV